MAEKDIANMSVIEITTRQMKLLAQHSTQCNSSEIANITDAMLELTQLIISLKKRGKEDLATIDKVYPEKSLAGILRQQLELLAKHSTNCNSSEIASITIAMSALLELARL